ncbi:MAG: hypothetical protein IJ833_08230 [Lachnospiraceae bacterium]|nr:hypothetical protein [Lachnospiraceae bacterium]
MKNVIRILYGVLLAMSANVVGLTWGLKSKGVSAIVWVLLLGAFVWINVSPSPANRKLRSKKWITCGNGCELLILFLISTVLTVVYYLGCLSKLLPESIMLSQAGRWMGNTVLAVIVLAITFWSGMIRVYVRSVQLGLKWRILGAVFGMVPIAHLIMLGVIIRTVSKEVQFENEKLLLNEQRQSEAICHTRYPVLMVHGVFFRDFRYLNYWGRIPEQLEKNGAKIYYGNHSSALAVEESAKELAARIHQIVQESGCEKVNVIAHSKGGLDTRCALMLGDTAQHVECVTTINTPH